MDSSVTVSYLEIYNEELSDLLVDRETSLKVCEDQNGVQCVGLSTKEVKSADEVLDVLRGAQQKRTTAETKMNKTSSRSHCLFTLTVCSKEEVAGGIVERKGKLHLVDLAGSECAKNTGSDANAARFRESQNINKSLLTLGRVISALRDKVGRIPYRDSKLTRLLQEALGGRSRTCIIATLSPSAMSAEESLSTLNYAEKAHGIKNKVVNASVRMHSGAGGTSMVGGGGGEGGHETRTFNELEQRMLYMQTRCEEAQAALGRKHDEMQHAVTRADNAEEKIEEMTTQIETVTANLSEAQEANEKLEVSLQKDRRLLAEKKSLLSERAKTETLLSAQARALLGATDKAVANGTVFHHELVERTAQQQAVKEATQRLSRESQAVLEAVSQELTSFCTAQEQRQDTLAELMGAAVAKVIAAVGSMDSTSSTMFMDVDSACTQAQSQLEAECEATGTSLTALAEGSQERSAAFSTQADAATTTALASIRGLQQLVADNKAFLGTWSQTATTRLATAQRKLDADLNALATTLDSNATAVANGYKEQQTQLQQERSQFQGFATQLNEHAAALTRADETITATQQALSRNVDKKLELLAGQHVTLAETLTEQREVSANWHNLHTGLLQKALQQVKDLSQESLTGLQGQLNTLQQSVDEHRTNAMPADAKHRAALEKTRAYLGKQVTAQLGCLRGQAANMTETLTASTMLGGAEATADTEMAAVRSSVNVMGQRTVEQQALLETQKAHLRQVITSKVEGEAGAVCVSHVATLEAQKAALELAMRMQQEGQAALVRDVMAGVQTLLASKMQELGATFAMNMEELQAKNTTLQGETAAWGQCDIEVAAHLREVVSENETVATAVNAARDAFLVSAGETETRVTAWRQLDLEVTQCVTRAVEQNAAAAAHEETMVAEMDVHMDALSGESAAWGASNAKVATLLDTAVTQNTAQQEMTVATEGKHTALLNTAVEQVVAWGTSLEKSTEMVQQAADENQGARTHVQATSTELTAMLTQSAGQVDGMQAETRTHSAEMQTLTEANGVATAHVEALQGELATVRVRNASAVSTAVESLTAAVQDNAMQVQEMQVKSEGDSTAFAAEASTTGGEVQKGGDLRASFLAEQGTALDTQLQGLHGEVETLLKAQNAGRTAMLSGAKKLQASLSKTAAKETKALQVAEKAHKEALADSGTELTQHKADSTQHTTDSKDMLRRFCDEEVQMATDAAAPADLEEVAVVRSMASTPADETVLSQNSVFIEADFQSLMTGIDVQVIAMNTEEGETVPRSARKTPKRPALASIDNVQELCPEEDPMSAKKVDSILMSPNRQLFKSPAIKRQKTGLTKPSPTISKRPPRAASATGMRQPSTRNAN
jgi:kinesin family protein 11